jgi:hypothetical protein
LAYGVDDRLPTEYKRHFRLIEKFVPVSDVLLVVAIFDKY